MSLEEFADNRKTKVAAFSLPPNILNQLEKSAASGIYGGKSAIVVQALTEFFAHEAATGKVVSDASIEEAVRRVLKSPEGEALIRSIIRKSLAETKEKAAATYAQSHDDTLPKYTPEKKEKAAAKVSDGTYHFDIQ